MRGALNARALALAFVVLGLFAGQAQAETKTIKSKVSINLVLDNFEFRGVVESGTNKCVKNRVVRYRVPNVQVSNLSAGTGEWSLLGDWYFQSPEANEVKVRLPESEKFGRPGHRKVCGADSAVLSAQREATTIENFAFDGPLDTFSGDPSSNASSCEGVSRLIQVYGPFPFLLNVDSSGGSFAVLSPSEPPAGSYYSYVFTHAVDFDSSANGNASVVACGDDDSPTISVT
jgi:hypothetical protein